MLAIARAMAALCASIGRLLAHCSDMPERLSASDARRAARPAPAFRDRAGARLRAAAANRRVAVRRRAGGDGSVSPAGCGVPAVVRLALPVAVDVPAGTRPVAVAVALPPPGDRLRPPAVVPAPDAARFSAPGAPVAGERFAPRKSVLAPTGALATRLTVFFAPAPVPLRVPAVAFALRPTVFAPLRACFEARGAGAADGRRGRLFVVDFLSAATERVGASSSGCGRQTIRSLPRCWTGAASSSLQIRRSTSSRTARSSAATRTLMSSWARRLVSISFSTAGVSPWWPTMTTGWSVCAFARSARRSGGGSVLMPRFYRARRGPDRTAGRRRCDGRIVMHKPV